MASAESVMHQGARSVRFGMVAALSVVFVAGCASGSAPPPAPSRPSPSATTESNSLVGSDNSDTIVVNRWSLHR